MPGASTEGLAKTALGSGRAMRAPTAGVFGEGASDTGARADIQSAPSVSKKSFRHAVRIFKLSKKFKNTCRLNAKGAFCPLHTSPAALSQTSSARFFDSLRADIQSAPTDPLCSRSSRRGRCPHRPARVVRKVCPWLRALSTRLKWARYRIAVCNAPGWLTGRRRRWFRRSRWTGRCSGRGS